MSKNVLTTVPGIGPARAKRLNENGIQTIEDLKSMSLEGLAAIKTIGMSNAERLVLAVNSMDDAPAPAEPEEPKVVVEPEEKTILEEMVQLIDPQSFKLMRKTRASLESFQETIHNGLEKLKPLGKKKWLKPYIEYKCQVKKIEKRIVSALGELEDLPTKSRKALEKSAKSLERTLQGLLKDIKKKKFEKVNKELDAFRRTLKALQLKK